jgi:hypothetical protein
MSNYLHLLFSKPLFGAATGIGATVLTYCGIITPVAGSIAAILAVIAAVYSLIHKRNQVLKDERELGDK